MNVTWLFVIAFGIFVFWSAFYVVMLNRVSKQYTEMLRNMMAANAEQRERMIQLALSKNIVDYTNAKESDNALTEEERNEPVEVEKDEVLMENMDETMFRKFIEKQLQPEEEVM